MAFWCRTCGESRTNPDDPAPQWNDARARYEGYCMGCGNPQLMRGRSQALAQQLTDLLTYVDRCERLSRLLHTYFPDEEERPNVR